MKRALGNVQLKQPDPLHQRSSRIKLTQIQSKKHRARGNCCGTRLLRRLELQSPRLGARRPIKMHLFENLLRQREFWGLGLSQWLRRLRASPAPGKEASRLHQPKISAAKGLNRILMKVRNYLDVPTLVFNIIYLFVWQRMKWQGAGKRWLQHLRGLKIKKQINENFNKMYFFCRPGRRVSMLPEEMRDWRIMREDILLRPLFLLIVILKELS